MSETETMEVLKSIARADLGEAPLEAPTEEPTEEVIEPTEQVEVEIEPEEVEETEQFEFSDDDMVKIVINGEEQEISFDNLKRGYMMQADYTRKTQELSETKKAINTELEQFRQINEQFKYEIDNSPEAKRYTEIVDGLKGYDKYKLNAEERQAYETLENEAEYLKRGLSDKAEKYKKHIELYNQQKNKELTERRAKENEELLKAIPDLADPSKKEETKRDILNVLESVFGKEQATAIATNSIDHRDIILFKLAAEGLKYQSKEIPKPTVKRGKTLRNGNNIKTQDEQGGNKALKAIKARGERGEATRNELREYFKTI